MRAAALVALAMALPACGGGGVTPGGDAAVRCSSQADCDDGLFCNGVERCSPDDDAADSLGCVVSAGCPVGLCEESTAQCFAECTGNPDIDGDGVRSVVCGGADCDDDDANRFPGNAEVCDAAGVDEDCDPATVGERDVDGDGVSSALCCNGAACGQDCDDARRGTNPSVPEVCDGLDNDCDGTVDEGLLVELFRDADHDGVGITASTALACPGAPGFASGSGDCDDTRASVRPTAPEICDVLDNDCDGATDEHTLAVPWYVDADGDGWGVVSADALPVDSCVPPANRAIRLGDCNDGDANVAPTARERCNGVDDDCSGRADFKIGAHDFEDDDSDGVPDAACAAATADCNDRDPTIAPGGLELCDVWDNDCDTMVDEGAADRAWYADMDGDGFGDPAATVSSCAVIPGRVLDASDCDDLNGSTNPGRSDACGGQPQVDDDCDEDVDEGGNALSFFTDADGDGYGTGTAIVACQSDAATATRSGDCDDTDTRVNPAALDDCAALATVDDDCDGRTDETLAPRVFYTDGDGDGYGAGAPMEGCTQPVGTSVLGGDCNDNSAARNPGVPDDCGTTIGVDDDCDVSVDEDLAPRTYYRDNDDDGYGAGAALMACVIPSGHVSVAGDCDDASATRNPAVPDDCTRVALVDDDCDGMVDEGAMLTAWYRDTDGDGFGAGAATLACAAPAGHTATAGDCDESRVAVNPGRSDTCTGLAGINDDCDAMVDEAVMPTAWYSDGDSDGYGTGAAVLACVAPAGHAALGSDCSDANPQRNPGRADDCTTTLGTDDDCDMTVDEDATISVWYRDQDMDGFGNPAMMMSACGAPAGFVSNSTDCNDAAFAAKPGATEVCNDVLDNDCDGDADCDDSSCALGCPTLTVMSGGTQSAALHMPFGAPIEVMLTDGMGMPIAGRTVSMFTEGVSTGANYSDASGYVGVTDAMGRVTYTPRAGLGLGVETVEFASLGVASTTAALTGTAPAVGTIFTVVNGAGSTTYGSVPGPARDARGSVGGQYNSLAMLGDGSFAYTAGDRILRVSNSGRTTVLAGGGASSLTLASDGAAATSVGLSAIGGILIAGNPAVNRLYFEFGCRVWSVDLTSGLLDHVAGTGTCSYTGDGDQATLATLNNVVDLAVSDTGVVYLTPESGGGGLPVRYIDTAGVIRTLITGGDVSGTLLVSGLVKYVAPIPGSVDVYVLTHISNFNRYAILRVAPDGSFTVVAGGGADATGESVGALSADLELGPVAALGDGSIVIAERSRDRLRRITGGVITTIAGVSGMGGFMGDGTTAGSARVDQPEGVEAWRGSHILFIDTLNARVRAIW